MSSFRTWLSGLTVAVAFLAAPAMAAIPAHPGMLNYVEGQARINGQTVTNTNVGTADISPGQMIETGNGKAEVLLTPGVFLRLGENSAVRLDSNGLTDTRIAVLKGHAMIEADNLQKENSIIVQYQSATARLEKNGIYSFSADPAQVATFDGKVKVTEDQRSVDIGKGHEANLEASLQPVKFDRKADENGPLYQWSKVRSEYLADANIEQARTLVVDDAGWYGGGWYWDPSFAMYSWIPGGGMFYNPFGWGFYSPFTVWSAPMFYGYHGYNGYRGYAGRGIGSYPRYRGFAGRSISPAPRAYGFSGPGFAHAGGGFHGGGFAHAGGGFHGGGGRR